MQRILREWRRNWRRFLARALMSAALINTAAPVLAAPQYRVGPPPDWVERITPDFEAAAPKDQVSGGVYYLLVDGQTRVGVQGQVQYQHLAMRAVNESGVEDVAHISVSFDPTYQALTLHKVQVYRNGKLIPKLRGATIRVLEREKELEYRIFDGRKSVNVFLTDVRVGDVVEYAYSIRGTNPVFGNRFFGRISLQWSVPVRHIVARLVWPQERPLYFNRHETKTEPRVREQGGYREYRWDVANAPALVVDDNAPSWYDPYPWVQWGEFKDWSAVAQWALPLYRVPERLSPDLEKEIDNIARASADPGQRMLAALRFVQGQIRYLGVEIGAGSHAPSAPEVVLHRRFGDCKDKSLLAVTMLRSLGIEAELALVNTNERRAIAGWQPTPNAFNHAIVRAHVKGEDYWIDPTRPPQHGDLATLYEPDYSYALLIDDATKSLTPMSPKTASISKRSIATLIDARAGIDKPATYTVTTAHEGGSAEAERSYLASMNREELEKRYLNFYVRYYPTIKMVAPIEVKDDTATNRLTIIEHYQVPDFFVYSEENKRREVSVYAPEMAEYVRRPASQVRRAPLAVRHPVDVAQTTEVLLPSAWDIKPEIATVVDPAFTFERKVAWDAQTRRVAFTDRFKSLTDHIMPADIQRYVANLDRASDNLTYSLYAGEPTSATSPPKPTRWIDKMNWPVALFGAMILLLWGWLAARLYRYDPPPHGKPVNPKLQGIRGWLLLPAIGVLVHPIRIVIDVLRSLPSYEIDTWSKLTTAGGAAYDALWAPLLLYELAANLALIVFSLVLMVLFFQKRRSIPMVYTGFLVASVLIHGTDLALASQVAAADMALTSKDVADLMRGSIGAAIWGAYFHVSKRVHSTFVNERKRPAPAVLTVAPATS